MGPREMLLSFFLQPVSVFMLVIDLVLAFFLLVESNPKLERFFGLRSLQGRPSRMYGGPQWLMNRRFAIWNLLPLVVFILGNAFPDVMPRTVYFQVDSRTADASADLFVIVRDAILLTLLCDVSFYAIHRLLHTSLLFGRLHVTHHSENVIHTSVFFLVDYVDGFINFTSIVFLPTVWICFFPLCKSSILIYFVAIAFFGAASHSAYDVAFGRARFHFNHHALHTCNFGAFGFMDWLCGTYVRQ
jgi:sterol desaturase/sphingolipid hydroxylase (fatty acid hydroxylase superfamily)